MRIENTVGRSKRSRFCSRIETHLHAAASGTSMYEGIASHSPGYLSSTMWPFGSMTYRPSPCMR